MQRLDRQSNGITDGVIWKQLLKFFLPIMLGTFFQQLYNTVDAIVVGNFAGKEALAAVGGSASRILDLVIGFFTGLASGATVIVSQVYGAKDEQNVSRSVHTAMLLALGGGAIMTVIGLLISPTLLVWMKTPPDTMAQSRDYVDIVFMAMIPGMVYNVGSAVLRAVGDSRRPLYFLIAACLTNIVLDVLFVVVLPVDDVKGVAIATSLSQVVSAILVCASLMRTKECYRLELKKLRTNLKLLGQTIRIGLPTGLQSIMYAVSNIIITTSINTFETDAVAAWVTLSKVDAMNWMIVNAFGIAVMTFVGQNYGAGRYDRVRRSMKTCLMMAMGTSILFGAVFALFGRTLFGLFNKDEDVLKLGVLMMMYMAPSYWLYGPIEIISGSLRGAGDSRSCMLIMLGSFVLFRQIYLMIVYRVWGTVLPVAMGPGEARNRHGVRQLSHLVGADVACVHLLLSPLPCAQAQRGNDGSVSGRS